MKRLFVILLALGLVSAALAITAQIDTTGNMIKVEQRSTEELSGGKAVTTIFLEWGNINELTGVGFHAFDGFVDPEYGEISVTDVRMFDSGGAYRIGCDDKITNEGSDYVEWRASTLGATDGLTVRIVSDRDTAIHVKVGEWYGEFSLKAGKVVSDSLRATTSVWSPGTSAVTTVHTTTGTNRVNAWTEGMQIIVRWGNLDEFDSTPFESFDGYAEITSGDATIKVETWFSWEKDGQYAQGKDDEVTTNGPKEIKWRASVKGGDSDGLNIMVTPKSGTVKVKVVVGDWSKTFTFKKSTGGGGGGGGGDVWGPEIP
ncbi:MAG: hypothetical protein A2Y64_06280 [Candidatus Coatesbacteria bacterium RBG_13_66_14]|uniref:Uncharacterized protein n=1 Tax=Candidatus Coatesbacteria bacterium RBG_13_66_14 TaxID=1817816 RepID=A0A1F5F4J9_9BACT|nr:MAG: hypothetical protein A2Y64_06280 [Candidatus Coatesbacteria bacterium RBG_13_66_14]